MSSNSGRQFVLFSVHPLERKEVYHLWTRRDWCALLSRSSIISPHTPSLISRASSLYCVSRRSTSVFSSIYPYIIKQTGGEHNENPQLRDVAFMNNWIIKKLSKLAIKERARVSKENFFVFQIPFFPVITKDLTFIHLGNDSIVDGLVSCDFFVTFFFQQNPQWKLT